MLSYAPPRQRFGKAYPSFLLVATLGVGVASPARAGFLVTVDAANPVFLAGRTDFSPAPPGSPPPGYLLTRNSPPGPRTESLPPFFAVSPGNRFQFDATGLVNYDTRGGAGAIFAPDVGFAVGISGLGGISGYSGPAGALLGVFLTGGVPSIGPPPAAIDFNAANATTFTTLTPGLGQVFFIGAPGTSSGGVRPRNFFWRGAITCTCNGCAASPSARTGCAGRP